MAKHTLMIQEPSLQAFKEANDTTIEKIYVNYRAPFINFARKFKLDDDEILDIYQDTIIILRENVINGKIKDFSCSIKTYLFGIGKNKIYAHLRKNNKMKVLEHGDALRDETENLDYVPEVDLNEQQTIVKEALEKMGGKCKLILELFYYRGLTIDEIRVRENYENNNTVKSQKSRCLRTLKNMILNPEG